MTMEKMNEQDIRQAAGGKEWYGVTVCPGFTAVDPNNRDSSCENCVKYIYYPEKNSKCCMEKG